MTNDKRPRLVVGRSSFARLTEEFRLKRRTRSFIIFAVTLVVVGVAGAAAVQYLRSGMTNLQLEAPETLQDAVIAAYLSANQANLEQPAGTDSTPIEFEIQPGESLVAIANRLLQQIGRARVGKECRA